MKTSTNNPTYRRPTDQFVLPEEQQSRATEPEGSAPPARGTEQEPTSSPGSDGQDHTKDVLTPRQAAEYLEVSLRSIYNLISEGQLPYVKVRRSTRILREDLIVFIARNRRKRRYALRAN